MKVSIPGRGVQYVGEKDPRPVQARPTGPSTPFLPPAQAIAQANERQARTDAANRAAASKATAIGPPHSINDKPETHS